MPELIRFPEWADVLDYAHTGRPLYYQAPMDAFAVRLTQCFKHTRWQPCAPYTYVVRGKTIRIFPPGSNRRPSDPDRVDPFTATRGHLDRFSRPVNGSQENPMRRRFRKKNPMTSTEDLLLAGAAVAVAGLVGYALYSKSQAAQTPVTPANQNVTQWNQTTQEAYDAWYMQQVNAGNITPTQG